MQGTVKWFNEMKGFGFIVPAEGGEDVFVHKSGIQGFGKLATGDRVKYDLDSDARGPKAVNVRVIE